MYKDPGINSKKRWDMITNLINQKIESFDAGQKKKQQHQVRSMYKLGESDIPGNTRDLYNYWALPPRNSDHEEVLEKIGEYRELEKRM